MSLSPNSSVPTTIRLLLVLACALACAAAASLLLNWHSVIAWILSTQQQLHIQLREHVSAVAQAPWQHGTLLIAASFGYGLFHAAGPGHGKALITSYLGTQTTTGVKQGISLSFLGSILQSLIAIGIVSLFALVLNISLSRINNHEWLLELVSYGLVALLGAVILGKALWQKRRISKRKSPQLNSDSYQFISDNKPAFSLSNTALPIEEHAPNCNCQHHVEIDTEAGWKEKFLLVFAMGFRPCSGALIVLVYAHLIGVYWFGIAAVLAMGVGTGMAVALIAFLVVHCRQWLTRNIGSTQQGSTFDGTFWLKIIGGGILLALGVSLLLAVNINPPTHPIL